MRDGLKNGPGKLHQAKDVLLTNVKLKFAQVYFQDTVIFLRTLNEHIDHQVRHVWTLFYNVGATLNINKTEFLQVLLNVSVMSLSLGTLKSILNDWLPTQT